MDEKYRRQVMADLTDLHVMCGYSKRGCALHLDNESGSIMGLTTKQAKEYDAKVARVRRLCDDAGWDPHLLALGVHDVLAHLVPAEPGSSRLTLGGLRHLVNSEWGDLPLKTEVRVHLQDVKGEDDDEYLELNGHLTQLVEDDDPSYVALSFKNVGSTPP